MMLNHKWNTPSVEECQVNLHRLGFAVSQDLKLEPIEPQKKNSSEEEIIEVDHWVSSYVQAIIEQKYALSPFFVPIDNGPEDPSIPIWLSEEALAQDVLLVIVPNATAHRPCVISNTYAREHSIRDASVLPLIKEALENMWGVALLNPYVNHETQSEVLLKELSRRKSCWTAAAYEAYLHSARTAPQHHHAKTVRGSETPTSHLVYVWDTVISTTSAHAVFVLTIGSGGTPFLQLMRQRGGSVIPRVRAVGFIAPLENEAPTTSAEKLGVKGREYVEFFEEKCRKWVVSATPINTHLPNEFEGRGEVSSVSAGTQDPRAVLGQVAKYVGNFFNYRYHCTERRPTPIPTFVDSRRMVRGLSDLYLRQNELYELNEDDEANMEEIEEISSENVSVNASSRGPSVTDLQLSVDGRALAVPIREEHVTASPSLCGE
eukprot:GCRY01002184.1.p1 GENE.GCRY01002184.1~~GCRY01002184.1.p1  ORF type:complete len:432 (+),score=102.63 GCRY01002184.1:166-1461(+)